MSTRKLIMAYLLRHGTAPSTSIYLYVVQNGGARKAAMSMLSDMISKGEVKSQKDGHTQPATVWLADPDAAIRSIGSDEVGPIVRRGAPLASNLIFTECREHSRIYQLDQLLRTAREVRV